MSSRVERQLPYAHLERRRSMEFWLLTLAAVAFFPSNYLLRSPAWHNAYDYVRDVATIVGVAFWLTHRGRQRTTLWMLLLALFYLEVELASMANEGLNMSMLRSGAYAFGFCAILDCYSERDMLRTVKAVRRGLEVLFWINLASIILKPEGLYFDVSEINGKAGYAAYFLGHRNNSIELYIPMVCLAGVESYLQRGRLNWRTMVLCVAALTSNVITWSANALLCMLLISLCFLLIYLGRGVSVRATTYALASLLASVGLIQFHIIDAFEWLITDVLHKSMTMSGRTLIWERSVAQIRTSPIYGLGIESPATKFLKIGMLNSCHNYFLDILYYGGFVLLGIVTPLFLLSFRGGNNLDPTLESIVSAGAGAYAILWLATPIHRGTIQLMFAFWLFVYKLRKRARVEESEGCTAAGIYEIKEVHRIW